MFGITWRCTYCIHYYSPTSHKSPAPYVYNIHSHATYSNHEIKSLVQNRQHKGHTKIRKQLSSTSSLKASAGQLPTATPVLRPDSARTGATNMWSCLCAASQVTHQVACGHGPRILRPSTVAQHAFKPDFGFLF